MKKITSILSLAAIVVSALCMSCAKSKTPDIVIAFPDNKYASYERNENGAYEWVVESQYVYQPYGTSSGAAGHSSPKRGGFENQSVPNKATINYWFEPNAEWTAEVMGIGKKYIQLGYGYGYQSENQVKGDIVSGGYGKGMEDLQIEIIALPELLDGDKECVIELEMNGQRMPLATIKIQSAIPVLSVPSIMNNTLSLAHSAYEGDLEFVVSHAIPNGVLKASISNGVTWLTISDPVDGKVHITCEENVDPVSREAIITFTYPEAMSLDVKVVQAGDIWFNIVSGNPTEPLAHTAGSFDLSYERKVADDNLPIDVVIDENATWLHVGAIDYDNNLIPFSYDANDSAPGSKPRVATVTLSFEGLAEPVVMVVKQNAEALPENPDDGGNTEGGNTEGGNTEGGNTDGGNTEGGNA